MKIMTKCISFQIFTYKLRWCNYGFFFSKSELMTFRLGISVARIIINFYIHFLYRSDHVLSARNVYDLMILTQKLNFTRNFDFGKIIIRKHPLLDLCNNNLAGIIQVHQLKTKSTLYTYMQVKKNRHLIKYLWYPRQIL